MKRDSRLDNRRRRSSLSSKECDCWLQVSLFELFRVYRDIKGRVCVRGVKERVANKTDFVSAIRSFGFRNLTRIFVSNNFFLKINRDED